MARISLQAREEHLEAEFHVSRVIIAYKFTLGLVEALSGVGLVLWGGAAYRLYQAFLLRELTEDPHAVLAHLTVGIVPSLLAAHTTLALYMIVLGAAKLAGAVGLIYQRNWGVDLLVSLTVLMFPFQVIGLIRHPSIPGGIYIGVGLLISLYLINFKPKAWVSKMGFLAKNQVEKIMG